eukprot:scaffold25347_cov16-Prasinocladus_malaysianus.AAC.1
MKVQCVQEACRILQRLHRGSKAAIYPLDNKAPICCLQSIKFRDAIILESGLSLNYRWRHPQSQTSHHEFDFSSTYY